MLRIKGKNCFTIKEYTKNDSFYNASTPKENFVVISPDNRLVLDHITFEDAESFCQNNHEYLSKKAG